MNIRTTKTLNNGVEIPMLGLGVFRSPNGPETVQAVKWALKAGYRHVDTASLYANEETVGQGIRESGIPRKQVFVTTKMWTEDMRKGRAGQRAAFEKSLSLLGLEYVDLYLLHWPVAESFHEAWKVMEEILRSGKARAIGVSNFHEHHLDELLAGAKVCPAVNQVECHPRLSQAPLVACCAKLGIAFETWSPLGGIRGDLMNDVTLKGIGLNHGKSIAQTILRWELQRGLVTIPKSVHKDRIEENADLYDFELTAREMALVDALNENRRFGADPENFPF